MLIACPECESKVSDRAHACPQCGFPIAEQVAAEAAAQAQATERTTRTPHDDVDCVACEARGFATFKFVNEDGEEREGFSWCEICEHSGRVAGVRSSAGYWAVRRSRLEAFLAGELDAHETDAVSLGHDAPTTRYPRSQ